MDNERVSDVEKRVSLRARLVEHGVVDEALLLDALDGEEELRVAVLHEPHVTVRSVA